MKEFIQKLPKAELHCHLEGAVPAETAITLACRNGISLPTTNPEDLYRFSTLSEFLTVYRLVCASIVTAADFAEVAYAAQVTAAQSSNLVYREKFVNPTNHPDLPYPELLAGMLAGLRAAEVDYGVIGRIIPAINREQPPSVALDLVDAVIAYRCDEVVGIGLDHNDALGPPELFIDAYRRAGRAGLHRTAHAGEINQAAQVVDSIGLLGCERIDHGYAVVDDPDSLEYVQATDVHFAACWGTCCWFHPNRPPAPWSPIAEMISAGLSVSINSDDPPMFATDIGREYEHAAKALSWSAQDAIDAAYVGLTAAWIDDTERTALTTRFAAEIKRLRPLLTPESPLAQSPTNPG